MSEVTLRPDSGCGSFSLHQPYALVHPNSAHFVIHSVPSIIAEHISRRIASGCHLFLDHDLTNEPWLRRLCIRSPWCPRTREIRIVHTHLCLGYGRVRRGTEGVNGVLVSRVLPYQTPHRSILYYARFLIFQNPYSKPSTPPLPHPHLNRSLFTPPPFILVSLPHRTTLYLPNIHPTL